VASRPQADTRRRNLGAVLRRLHQYGPTRQVDLSDGLGINRSTGVSLVDQLVDLRLVKIQDNPALQSRGRPSPLVAPAPDVVVLAAELTADRARVDLIELGGTLRVARDLPIVPSELTPAQALRAVATTAHWLVRASHGALVVGAAVAVHGAVDRSGRVMFAPNLGWEGADVGTVDAALRAALPGQPLAEVVVGNEADFGAVGEVRRGAGRGCRNVLYVSSERGIGGGIVVDGELLAGATGLAGEIGHVKVPGGAATCGCGQAGCWETEIGLPVLEQRAGVRAAELFDLAAAGRRRVQRAVATTAIWLGRGLGGLVAVLQPDAVVLGGHLRRVADLAPKAVWEGLVATCPPVLAAATELRAAQLGQDAALVGAAEIAFDALFGDPARVA
jgi:predicted NBD/HSP70 family sugar kinase